MEDSREDALARHDAISHLLEDLAVAVAFLPDLRDLEEHLPAAQPRAYRQLLEPEALRHDILAEGPERHLRTAAAEVLDFLQAKETDLPVPVPRMGIPCDAIFRDEARFFYRMLLRPPLLTDANCLDLTHSRLSSYLIHITAVLFFAGLQEMMLSRLVIDGM